MTQFWQGLWPKAPKTRRRLMVFLAAGLVLCVAIALALFALKDGVVYFYTPSQAVEAKVPLNRPIRLGGLVVKGSIKRQAQNAISFEVTDNRSVFLVSYQGDLPDLFREGQGVVCEGTLIAPNEFKASTVLAKHDEKYMPKDVEKALKAQGQWREDKTTGAPS